MYFMLVKIYPLFICEAYCSLQLKITPCYIFFDYLSICLHIKMENFYVDENFEWLVGREKIGWTRNQTWDIPIS
jgi:hypothetical protein